jgi:hypothetical protein
VHSRRQTGYTHRDVSCPAAEAGATDRNRMRRH